MNVAIIFFGAARRVDLTIESIKRNIHACNQGLTLYTIASLTMVDRFNNPRNAEDNVALDANDAWHLRADAYAMLREDDAAIAGPLAAAQRRHDLYGNDWLTIRHVLHQLASLRRAWRFCAQDVPIAFDYFLFLRPDLIYLDEIRIADIIEGFHGENNIALPAWASWNGLNDRFALADPKAARLYANRLDLVEAYTQTNNLHPETLLAHTLHHAASKVCVLPARARRVRANATTAYEDFGQSVTALPVHARGFSLAPGGVAFHDTQHGRKTSILLVHHTFYHFELLLGLAALLRSHYAVTIWSNHLYHNERTTLCHRLGLKIHEPGTAYGIAIILTGDDPQAVSGIDQELDAILAAATVINANHLYRGAESRKAIYLHPNAPRPVIFASTGLPRLGTAAPPGPLHFIIQDNLHAHRRAYGLLAGLNKLPDNVVIDIVGRGEPDDLPAAPNLRVHLSLDEIRFHEVCARGHFIIPLIDPEQQPQYFTAICSSSINIGLSYALPFIAHERLFSVYPIHGLSYTDDAGLAACIENAANLPVAEYQRLVGQMEETRRRLHAANLANFQAILADALAAEADAGALPLPENAT
jgi:hypothetical protein